MCGYICGRGRHIFTTPPNRFPEASPSRRGFRRPSSALLSFPFLRVPRRSKHGQKERGGEREGEGIFFFSSVPRFQEILSRYIYIYIYCLIRREKNGRQRVNLETCCFVIEHSRMFGTDWEEEERMVTFEIFL